MEVVDEIPKQIIAKPCMDKPYNGAELTKKVQA